MLLTVKTRVRTTSETVVGDVEVHHQRYRSRRNRKVCFQLDIPTMSTPTFSNVLSLGVMCGVEKVNQLLNHPVMSLFDTRRSGTSTFILSTGDSTPLTPHLKFMCIRIKKKRKPRVKIVTLKLCGVWKSRYNLYEKHPTCTT